MRLSIKYKIFGPLLLCSLIFGGAGYWYMQTRLDLLLDAFLQETAANKADQITSGVDMLSNQAVEEASLFAGIPEVVDAFRLAHSGDITDENDPKSQEARERLRRDLAPFMQSFKAVTGYKIKLHFHLPSGHSLVRMWRSKQSRRDGEWVDISDDISSFRKTVHEVNAKGDVVKGVELGRSGFAIRGLAPVKAPDGEQLGSVEVLVNFAPLLKGLALGPTQSAALYMDSGQLSITTGLRDESKHPVLDDRFVTVIPSSDPEAVSAITPAFLSKAFAGLHAVAVGDLALAGFPVRDFKGDVIGAIVFAGAIAKQQSLIASQGVTFGVVLALILAIAIGVMSVVFGISVQKPTRLIIDRIKDIAEDKADLRAPLQVNTKDEMGELSNWFNALMGKIDNIICRAETYMNIMNSLPDLMFAVDDKFRILIGNKAMAAVAGVEQDKLQELTCSEVLKTANCGTPDCPIARVKKENSRVQSDSVEVMVHGTRRIVRPYSDALKDCHGAMIGYFGVAKDVTDLHDKEQELSSNLSRIAGINRRVNDASTHIADLAEEVSNQVDEARHGSEVQRRRVTETATAMEQMNASILEVARNASAAAQEAEQTMSKAQEGSGVVGQAVEAIQAVFRLTEGLKSSMSALGGQAQDIGRIITVIEDIADQTNLLALNAAIEAARAGDAGRGFAVVADEVRKLAEKTMTATKEVGQAVGAIQHGAKENIQSMETAAEAVERTTGLAAKSGEALAHIVALAESTADQVRSIASASEEQSAASEQITTTIEEVHRISGETASGMTESAQSMQRLAELAQTLQRESGG